MIYEKPKFLPGGDRYMLIEFGNEMNLELNFMAQGLAGAIEKSQTKAVIETAPCFASMLVHYDPDAISFKDLAKEMTSLIGSPRPVRRYRAGQPPVLLPDLLSRSLDQGGSRRLLREDHQEEMGPGVRRRAERPEGRASVRARAFRHRVLGGVAGILAGPALHDGARSALRDHGAEIQSAAHLDAAGNGRHGRRLDGDLSGGDARRLSDLRPHSGADLGHREALPAVREEHLPVPAGRPREVRAGQPAGVRGGRGAGEGRHLCLQRGRVPALLGAQLQELGEDARQEPSGSRRTAPCSK